MADGVFNIAKGRGVELYNRVQTNDPTNAALVIVALKASVADATLEDFDDLAAILADAGVDEADFTNYARKTLVDTDLTAISPDDANNRFDIDIPDQTYVAAGGAANNTLVKLIVCFDPDTTGGDDSAIIPISHHDFAVTTDGNNLQATINAAGFLRAA